MMFYIYLLWVFLQIFNSIEHVNAHGYLADPPARSTAWLYDDDFRACCTYFDHNQMFCGGTQQQWKVNGGKCSICGEAYNTEPKLFGVGNSMYLGKIVRTYQQGTKVPVTVVLTANHQGIFEFRLCDIGANPKEDASQNCLDQNVLNVTDNSNRYRVSPNELVIYLNVSLPTNFICEHCVFQWKYVTGNSWGTGQGRACLGCGKENEEFYGCADIAIVKEKMSVESIVDVTTPAIRTKPTTTVSTSTIAPRCTSLLTFSQVFDLTEILIQYCERVCAPECPFEQKLKNKELFLNCAETCTKLCYCK